MALQVEKKIAVINNFHPFTGLGKYALNLFLEMRKKNNAEMLYLETKDNRLNNVFRGIKKIRQEFSFPFWNKTLSWYYYFPPRIPDGYSLYHCTSQYLGKIARFRKPAIISHFDIAPLVFPEEYPFHLRFFLKKALSFYREAEKIHISSEKRREEVINLGINEEKIVFVPAGIDEKVFFPAEKEKARKNLGLPLNKKIILNVGSEEARKNIPVLLEAVKELQKNYSGLLLARIGSKNQKYDEIKKNINILHFSNIPEEKLRLFYSAADLLVFPTLYEGFGYPALEAMACGCPVITTEEMSVFADGCILVEKNNGEQIIQEAEKLLENEKLRKKYSKKAIQLSKNFSMKKTAEKMLQLYDSVRA